MLELLIGNIASGKSTYAKKRVQEGWFCISDDAIINMLLADQYSLYTRKYQRVVEGLMLLCAAPLLTTGRSVCVDSSWLIDDVLRQEWHTLYPGTIETWFLREAPEVHAARRMVHDPRGGSYESWLEVAKRMDALYKN